MSAIFPINPTIGQRFPVADTSVTPNTYPKWEWNGDKWSLIVIEDKFLATGLIVGDNIELSLNNNNKIDVDISSLATVTELNTAIDTREGTLTAGTNITIENNIISASSTNSSTIFKCNIPTIGLTGGELWNRRFTYSQNLRVGNSEEQAWIEIVPGLKNVELDAQGTSTQRADYLILDGRDLTNLTNRTQLDIIDSDLGR